MAVLPVEARDGDLVVVGASRAPDGRLDTSRPQRFAVIEWGTFELVSERMSDLSKDDAIVEARLCASERGRDAWDSTGPALARLPRLPLVYRGVGTYSVSVDVSTASAPGTLLQWQSATSLTEAEAMAAIKQDGVPHDLAKALIGKAPMPEACS